MKFPIIVLSLCLYGAIQAYPKTEDIDTTTLQIRQSAVDFHKWENIWGNGPWCFWWCSRRGSNKPSQDPYDTEMPADNDQPKPKVDAAGKSQNDQNSKQDGGKNREDQDKEEKKNIKIVTSTHTTDIIVARTEASVYTSFIFASLPVDPSQSILTAPTPTCHFAINGRQDTDGAQMTCSKGIEEVIPEKSAITPATSATTTSTTTTSKTEGTGQATFTPGSSSGGGRLVLGRERTLVLVAVMAVVCGMVM